MSYISKQLQSNITFAFLLITVLFTLSACGSSSTPAQAGPLSVSYSFTSGNTGDGFDWPASPAGLIDGGVGIVDSFTAPDGVEIFHDLVNPVFFDNNHILPTASTGLTNEVMWGTPKEILPNPNNALHSLTINFPVGVDSVAFDFAWAIAGENAPSSVEIGVGTGSPIVYPLNTSFNAGAPFGNSTGYSARIEISTQSLLTDFGITASDIPRVSILLDAIFRPAAIGEFAIDNFTAASK